MANILLLKRRITAAQNVSKTTRALHLIAASKLKRGEDKTFASRPYSEKLTNVLQNIVSKLDKENYHDYMKAPSTTSKDLLIVFAPDKGLCGGLIGNLMSLIFDFSSKNPNALYITVGKKIEKHVASQKREIAASFKFGTALPTFDMVYPIMTIIDDYFLKQKVKTVKILYTQFVSVFSQKQNIINLLPIEVPKDATKESSFSTIFEPSPQSLLPVIVKHYLENTIYQSLLESYASEQGARMIAMQNATDNAFDITNTLKLEYNKVRQERITNEILDIGSATFSQSL